VTTISTQTSLALGVGLALQTVPGNASSPVHDRWVCPPGRPAFGAGSVDGEDGNVHHGSATEVFAE